jgi:hypothetical protein
MPDEVRRKGLKSDFGIERRNVKNYGAIYEYLLLP